VAVHDDDFEELTREQIFARGTAVDSGPRQPYRVTILYREPEVEARNGVRPTPFRWTYRMEAFDRDAAAAAAVSEFHETARQSSVGWRRDIVAVMAEPADEATDA
jgi:hypothetical protein